jgi:hypothetical protein
MPPVEEVDISAVRYKSPALQAPHLTGFSLRAFVWLMESPLLGRLITSVLKSQNNMPQAGPHIPSLSPCSPRRLHPHSFLIIILCMPCLISSLRFVQMLQQTVIPERPMYYPEFPLQGKIRIPIILFSISFPATLHVLLPLLVHGSSV